MIAFSGYVQWNFKYSNVIIYGEIIVLLINKFFSQKELKYQIAFSVLISIFIIMYIFCGISLAISFEFAFVPIIIWSFIKNIENIKKNKINIILLVASVFLSILIYKFIFLKMNFIVRKEYIENDYGTKYLFSYLYNVLLPFKKIQNANIYGSFMSIFPVPMFIALYYIYKSEKHTEFLFPASVFAAIGTIFCISGFTGVTTKILGLSRVNLVHIAVAINLNNLFILIYMIGNIEEKVFKVNHAMRVIVVFCCLLGFINYPSSFALKKYLILYIAEFASTGFLFLNFEDKKYKKVLLAFLVIITLISGAFVNKLTKKVVSPKYIDTYAISHYSKI